MLHALNTSYTLHTLKTQYSGLSITSSQHDGITTSLMDNCREDGRKGSCAEGNVK